MNNSSYADYDHLLKHAQDLFPGASIQVAALLANKGLAWRRDRLLLAAAR